jgi:hypothetical protein
MIMRMGNVEHGHEHVALLPDRCCIFNIQDSSWRASGSLEIFSVIDNFQSPPQTPPFRTSTHLSVARNSCYPLPASKLHLPPRAASSLFAMSRKPSDTFTRFTPTAPHASRPAPSPPQPQTTPPSPSETPTQRVARLRAAHAASRLSASLSPLDRLIHRGRIWADITHRITAYTLIGFAGLAACVAGFSLISLITHNRRQKRAWIEREMGRLHDAQSAFLQGTADPEQLHLLEQERAGEEIVRRAGVEKERRKDGGILGRAKAFMNGTIKVGDLGREEEVRQGGERILEEVWVERTQQQNPQFSRSDSERAVASGVHGVGLDSKGRPVPMDRAVKEYEARQTAQGPIRTAPKEVNAPISMRGGPLDVMAGNIAGTVTSDGSGGWLSWLRSSKS